MSEPNGNNNMSQEEAYDTADIEKNKIVAGIAYLIFFLPLLICPDSRYARYHANQSLLLFIVSIAGSIILSIIPIIGWLLLPIFSIVVFIFAIMGLVNGLGGKAKELPLIGRYRLLR